MPTLVAPHGGTLVDRVVSPAREGELRAAIYTLPRLTLDALEVADLELIATGAASPLTGFLGKADYDRVLAESRLSSGVVWPLPFVAAPSDAERGALRAGGEAALYDPAGRLWGVLHVSEIYPRDLQAEIAAVYGTDDAAHPGVAYTLGRPAWAVGGDVEVLALSPRLPFARYRLTPRALRAELAARGWSRVGGFQTRNPMHRAHEHLTKLALEVTDGIVIHPLVGETRHDDVPAAVRFQTYEALIATYYPAQRTLLAAFPGAMRHAGPREALFHVLARKNYGISHLIVGRDHAGVGGFYPTRAAQEIFDAFSPEELGVQPLRLEAAFYCRACGSLASSQSCAHDPRERLELSGSRMREVLKSGGELPVELTRPEVAAVLRAHYRPGAPAARSPAPPPPAAATQARLAAAGQPGFILWFTGMSGAGKSTLAAAVAKRLTAESDRRVEILDGDEVRTHLSKGLGFSREDRDTNVHRIGFVARTLAKHGVGVLTAAISPYAETRRAVRDAAEALGVAVVEVYASAPLDALVARDVKGLYEKALSGEIAHFTGVSDPYEAPTAPDIEVRTDRETIDESVDRIVAVLRARGLAGGGVHVLTGGVHVPADGANGHPAHRPAQPSTGA